MKLKHKLVMLAASSALLLGATQAIAKDFYRLATLGPGSSPYMVMSTFAQLVNERIDGEIQVNATGAATQHAMEAASGKLDFFMWSASVHDSMEKGINMYAKIPQAPELSKDLRAVFAFPLGLYHIITYADSGIESLEDIKGKSVFLGPPGGGATVIMRQIVAAATGYEPGKDFNQVSVGWEAAAQAFQDGRLDVYINSTIAPSPVIEQIAISRKIRLIGITPEHFEKEEVKKVLNRPGGVSGTIPAGTYGTNHVNTEDVHTLGSIVGVGVGKHLSDDAVYAITKAFWEGAEKMRTQTPWLRQVSIETAFDDLNLPLHPGAERYYREIGLDIPAELVAK